MNQKYWNKEDCIYNPYISKWENETGYVPDSTCGRYMPDGKFKRNMRYIKELNQSLWH